MASDERTQNPCQSCGARVAELRRGRCWGCYMRWSDARPVGYGASCCICEEPRRDNLRSLELYGRWVPVCHNCASRTARLEPVPPTLDALKVKLERDRRTRLRRTGKADSRVFLRERRRDDRRSVAAAGQPRSDDRQLPELRGLLDGFEAPMFAEDSAEQTVIREMPAGFTADGPPPLPERTHPSVIVSGGSSGFAGPRGVAPLEGGSSGFAGRGGVAPVNDVHELGLEDIELV